MGRINSYEVSCTERLLLTWFNVIFFNVLQDWNMNSGTGWNSLGRASGYPLATVHSQNGWKYEKTFFRWPPPPWPCPMSSEIMRVEEYEVYKIWRWQYESTLKNSKDNALKWSSECKCDSLSSDRDNQQGKMGSKLAQQQLFSSTPRLAGLKIWTQTRIVRAVGKKRHWAVWVQLDSTRAGK